MLFRCLSFGHPIVVGPSWCGDDLVLGNGQGTNGRVSSPSLVLTHQSAGADLWSCNRNAAIERPRLISECASFDEALSTGPTEFISAVGPLLAGGSRVAPEGCDAAALLRDAPRERVGGLACRLGGIWRQAHHAREEHNAGTRRAAGERKCGPLAQSHGQEFGASSSGGHGERMWRIGGRLRETPHPGEQSSIR